MTKVEKNIWNWLILAVYGSQVWLEKKIFMPNCIMNHEVFYNLYIIHTCIHTITIQWCQSHKKTNIWHLCIFVKNTTTYLFCERINWINLLIIEFCWDQSLFIFSLYRSTSSIKKFPFTKLNLIYRMIFLVWKM